ncbi:MAG: glycine--tRNA ligase subunit beta [Elusimicrobiota bacterium]|jgi:glycyl-tRNA synthetase beta chain|nr:glycine--tRNA ligase subunit beta [Elusimicrobiota bacterium]
MNNALLEIFTEHLPARFVLPALAQMQTLADEILNRRNLKYSGARAFGTYRRLVLEIKDLAPKAEDTRKEIKGPPAALLKTAGGGYTQQAEGFAQKNGLDPRELAIVDTEKGPFIYARVKIKGESAAKLLPEVFKEIISSLAFPKNMVWEESGFKFARPIRGLIGLYGGKAVKFEVAGVKSGRATYPISSFGMKPIRISSPENYARTLASQPQPVLAEPQDRRKALLNAVNSAAARLGYKADLDEDLISETISFTEHPVALAGDMDIKFLALPEELIMTVLKKQLRMFPVLDEVGKPQPHFIAVRDGISANADEVREGFKNVMAARLTDAVFFLENDLKTGLDKMRRKLAGVNFIDGMGSMLDKTERVEKLALQITANLDEKQAAALRNSAKYCYADLTGGVVYEFPQLQGYMGAVYARAAGLGDEAAKAMEEFYLPLSASGELPQSYCGAALSLAGKMDTLAANFAAGNIPTGSEDPFALRRAAMGAVRIMLKHNFALSLNDIIAEAAQNLPPAQNSKISELRAFIWQRAAYVFEREHGLAPDEIAAVEGLEDATLPRALSIARALRGSRQSAALAAVGESAKRVGNILKKSGAPAADIDEILLKTEAEKQLYKTLLEVRAAAPEKNAAVEDAFAELAKFKDPLERFFSEVMVNDSDEKLRNTRLALLEGVNNLLTKAVADLSKLQKRG